MRVWLLLFLSALPVLGQETAGETPVAQEQRLRQALAAHAVNPARREADELALAELLVFTLERDFAEALALAEPLLARAEAADPVDPELVDKLRHLVGFGYSYTGRNAEAERLLLAVRDAQTTRLGAEADATLKTRGDLCVFYGRIGRPDLAEPQLREIAQILTARDPDGNRALHAQTEWSITLGRLGRWNDAERVLRDVIARHIRLFGSENPTLAHPLNLLCWVLFSTDRAADCVPLLEQIVAMREAERGVDSTSAMTVRFNLAATYLRVGRYDEAEKLWRADLARLEARPDEGWHEPAGYLRKLGELAMLRGNPADAVTDLTRAEALFTRERANGWRDAESREFEYTRFALTRALAATGDEARAALTATAWLEMFEDQFRQRLLFTSEADRLAFQKNERPFDLVGTLGNPALLARASLHFKGLVLDSLIEDQTLARAAKDPAIADLLSSYRAALSSLAQSDADASSFEFSEVEQLERELTRRTHAPNTTRAALTADPAAVPAALPPDTALIDYLRYTHIAAGEPEVASYLALIGTQQGWQVVRLGPAAPIEDAVARYQILTARGGPLAWAREVRQRVLDPVRAVLPKTISRLVIAPDASLHAVAFATLPEENETQFALESHRYARVTSARDLLPRPDAVGEAAVATAPLIIAEPTLRGTLAEMPPLPAALAEGQILAQRWPEARLLTGDAATPAALAAHPSPRWLHIASHAIAAADASLPPTEAMRQTGLALAGENGWLDALQIASLDLRATELVFLSACSTGVGTTASGEGVLGLQRGFARAGARALVATLWPVADADSRAFAQLFYDALAQTGDAADALRAAQRALLAQLIAEGVSPVECLRRAGAHVLSVRR